MAKLSLNKEYKQFLATIKEKVYQSQYQAMKQVNKALINLYWEIGQSIVEKQQQHNWGKSVAETPGEGSGKRVPRNGRVQQGPQMAHAHLLPGV